MELTEFKEKFFMYLEEMDMILDEEQVKQFYDYMKLLLEWNEKMNLTAITDENEIILKHFVDSLTILKYIEPNEKLIDVGTGAGFPGVPIKIARKDVKIVLMDSLQKRLTFLEDVISKLQLKNIETVHARAEELARNKKFRESFDVVTSRAVANLATLSEYMIPFAKLGGKCISMKGSEIEEEKNSASHAIKILGGKIVEIDSFFLANTDMKRNIVVIDKVSKTPSVYPRKAGMPSKQPIS